MMYVGEKYQKRNYHICSIRYWILHAMKKYWSYIKECAGDICIHIRIKFYIEAYRDMWEDEEKDVNNLSN